MEKFEYKKEYTKYDTLLDFLNQEGQKGWEAIDITWQQYFQNYQVIFKRKINQ